MNSSKTFFNVLILCCITLASCSLIRSDYTKNWQGSDVPGHIYASFDGFNGKQDFNVKTFANGKMNLKYTTSIPTGQMELEIVCANKQVLNRDVSGTVKDSIRFDNPGNNPVKIILKAQNAAGKFDITY